MEQVLKYNEDRKTWNLYVNGEWYYEGTYEECQEIMINNSIDEDY